MLAICELFEKEISKSTNILMGLSCGATLFCLVEGLATALPAVAPLDAFPFCLPQGKSPALCQREGTEGRECKYSRELTDLNGEAEAGIPLKINIF